jgi:hypothetical protein
VVNSVNNTVDKQNWTNGVDVVTDDADTVMSSVNILTNSVDSLLLFRSAMSSVMESYETSLESRVVASYVAHHVVLPFKKALTVGKFAFHDVCAVTP